MWNILHFANLIFSSNINITHLEVLYVCLYCICVYVTISHYYINQIIRYLISLKFWQVAIKALGKPESNIKEKWTGLSCNLLRTAHYYYYNINHYFWIMIINFAILNNVRNQIIDTLKTVNNVATPTHIQKTRKGRTKIIPILNKS